MNNPVPGFNDGNERKANLLKSLADFTKEHRAAHWAGTFASFLEQIFPHDTRGLARTSHQYVWDMMRAEGFDDSQGRFRCQLFEDELYGINDTIERVTTSRRRAPARKLAGACSCC
jgi:serine protein kinase